MTTVINTTQVNTKFYFSQNVEFCNGMTTVINKTQANTNLF